MILLLSVVVVPVLVAAGALAWWLATRDYKRHVTQTQTCWRADYEDWLWTHGHPTGFYGQWPPTPIERKP